MQHVVGFRCHACRVMPSVACLGTPLHAHSDLLGGAFQADAIKLRDTFGAQLFPVFEPERLGVQSLNPLFGISYILMDAEDFNMKEIRREIAAGIVVSL